MTGLASALAVVGGIVMCVVTLHWIVEAIRRGATAEARLQREEARRKLLERQAIEIAKEKTLDEIIRDLDAGKF